jgi:UDP-N-acetylmuramoyl-tripeptide--D-alanyl-D-alanine ligase
VGAFALTAAEAAAAARGRVVQGDPATRLDRITIDSRTAARGEFFVAIKGERFDGHAFVADALARGVAGVMVHEAIEPPQGAGAAPVVIRVEETTRALQDVAHEVRRRSGAQVVAITGSAGKTTTKDVAAEFLSTRYRVFKNKGNLNNHIGLPLSLLELRSGPELAVVELGMNHPGEIRTLVGIAAPDVRVWTNVGDAHLGFFESPDAIAQAKAEILEHADANDLLVANANDPRVMTRAEWFVGRVRTFGIDVPADVAATMVEHRGLDGTTARLRTREGETQLTTPLLGLGNLSNVLAAATVAIHFDIPVSEIVERAAELKASTHRGELLRLPGGLTLVDDSYNSSPAALKQALATIASAKGCARRVAVLGEMLELGAHAARLHEESGRAAAAASLDLLITVGGAAARALGDAAIAAGLPAGNVAHAATNEAAAAMALARIRPGDLVLVKGSRGIGTDLVVDRLKAEFA